MGRNYERTTPEEIEANLTRLDFEIFRLLPDEGSEVGFMPKYLSSAALAKLVNQQLPADAHLKPSQVGSRLRGLLAAHLVAPVSTSLTGRPSGWQRTPRAVELLNAQEGGESGLDR